MSDLKIGLFIFLVMGAPSIFLVMDAPSVAASHHEAAELRSALTDSARAQGDKARDEGRKPADVLAFLGIRNGMTVMDVIAAGGYYTEVLSIAVGSEGRVYAQNPAAVLQFRDGANDKAMTARLAEDRLANVERWDREFDDIGLEAGILDAAITALNFHDIYNRDPGAAVEMLRTIRGLLKPGGVLGIVDHSGNSGANNAELHRIEKQKVIDAAIAAGLEVDGDSDLLANGADDHSQMVFAPEIRGKTDRFLLRLVVPSDPTSDANR
jgi:predicted methyltransferase